MIEDVLSLDRVRSAYATLGATPIIGDYYESATRMCPIAAVLISSNRTPEKWELSRIAEILGMSLVETDDFIRGYDRDSRNLGGAAYDHGCLIREALLGEVDATQ